jgi:hypothetical protein
MQMQSTPLFTNTAYQEMFMQYVGKANTSKTLPRLFLIILKKYRELFDYKRLNSRITSLKVWL